LTYYRQRDGIVKSVGRLIRLRAAVRFRIAWSASRPLNAASGALGSRTGA